MNSADSVQFRLARHLARKPDVARAVFEAQSFENKMLKAYIRDWPVEGEE